MVAESFTVVVPSVLAFNDQRLWYHFLMRIMLLLLMTQVKRNYGISSSSVRRRTRAIQASAKHKRVFQQLRKLLDSYVLSI